MDTRDDAYDDTYAIITLIIIISNIIIIIIIISDRPSGHRPARGR